MTRQEFFKSILVMLVSAAFPIGVLSEELDDYDFLPIGNIFSAQSEVVPSYVSIANLAKKSRFKGEGYWLSSFFGGRVREMEFVVLVWMENNELSGDVLKNEYTIEYIQKFPQGAGKVKVKAIFRKVFKAEENKDVFSFIELNRKMLLRVNCSNLGNAIGMEAVYFVLQVGPMAGELPGGAPKSSTAGNILSAWLMLASFAASEEESFLTHDNEWKACVRALNSVNYLKQDGQDLHVIDHLSEKYEFADFGEFFNSSELLKLVPR